jgi:hypothetical protein
MSPAVQNILASFDLLPDMEKHEVAAEILRRSGKFDPLEEDDEMALQLADQLFQEYDREEAAHDSGK